MALVSLVPVAYLWLWFLRSCSFTFPWSWFPFEGVQGKLNFKKIHLLLDCFVLIIKKLIRCMHIIKSNAAHWIAIMNENVLEFVPVTATYTKDENNIVYGSASYYKKLNWSYFITNVSYYRQQMSNFKTLSRCLNYLITIDIMQWLSVINQSLLAQLKLEKILQLNRYNMS